MEIQRNQTKLKDDGMEYKEAYLKGIEEYALECSIIKVVASENVSWIADEGV